MQYSFSGTRDDFATGGTREGSAWLGEVLRKVFIVNDRGVLGLVTRQHHLFEQIVRMVRLLGAWR